MTIDLLTEFFKWCTVMNGALLIFWSAIVLFAPSFVYNLHAKWFTMSQDAFDKAMYYFLGGFKLLFVIFNLVPFLALSIISA
jgi:hypothetical protein